MNYLFVLAVVAGFGNSMSHEHHRHTEPFGQYELECAKEKNVSMEALAEAEDGIFTEQANIHKFNCFAECIFYKLNFFIPGSNVVQMEEIRKQAMKKGGEKYVEIAERCTKFEAPIMCDRTYEMYKCYYTEVNKLEKTNPAPSGVVYSNVPIAQPAEILPALSSFGDVLPGAPKEVAPFNATGGISADSSSTVAPVLLPQSDGRRAGELGTDPAPSADPAAAPAAPAAPAIQPALVPMNATAPVS